MISIFLEMKILVRHVIIMDRLNDFLLTIGRDTDRKTVD